MEQAPRPMRTWRAGEIAVVVLAILATIAAAKAAEAFLVPVVVGVILAYALKPIVNWLENIKLPRPIGATVVLALVTALVLGAGILIKEDASAALAELPDAARKVRLAAQETGHKSENPLGHVRAAAAELDRAASEAVGSPPAETVPRAAAPAAPPSELNAWASAQSSKALGTLGDLGIGAMVALFLLSTGDTFRRKVVSLAGPTLAARRVTVEILDEMDKQVQRYLLVLLVTNLLVGVAIWALLASLGMHRAELWGTLAAIVHVIPYAGTAITTAAIGIAAFLQFGTIGHAAGVAAAVLVLSSAIGLGLTSWLQGKASHMNPVAVFIALLFFGWLWGGWGLLIGAPLVAIAKTVCDRVPSLNAFGEFLG